MKAPLEALQYTSAFLNYITQFNKVLELARQNPDKQVVYHPTALGGGVFGNDPELIAKGFRAAAVWFQQRLNEEGRTNVYVQFEAFVAPNIPGQADLSETVPVGFLHLQETPRLGEGPADPA